jgi:glycosyltransferase involved in cell wall biosynthesis
MEDSADIRPRKKVDKTGNRFLSVVIPVYNEEEVLRDFHSKLARVLNNMEIEAEILYVNDGSADDTLKIMHDLRQSDQRVSILDLSRNFGKETAMTAGLDHASGDAVILIDADLQHPPELIPELVKHWIGGYDIVYTTNVDRFGETIVKKFTTHLFYRCYKDVWTCRYTDERRRLSFTQPSCP